MGVVAERNVAGDVAERSVAAGNVAESIREPVQSQSGENFGCCCGY